MSLKKVVGKLLLLIALQGGAFCGMLISPQQIEDLMEVMNRVQVVRVIHKERIEE